MPAPHEDTHITPRPTHTHPFMQGGAVNETVDDYSLTDEYFSPLNCALYDDDEEYPNRKTHHLPNHNSAPAARLTKIPKEHPLVLAHVPPMLLLC